MSKTKSIKLRTGETVKVSAADYPYLAQFEWYGKKQHGKVHAYRKTTIGKKLVGVRMQREVMHARHIDKVQFVNGDTLNCTRENLEVLTLNPKVKKFEPRWKGVSVNGNRFRARINHAGKEIHLGYYTDPVEAARAYDEAAVKLHGDRAITNL